MLKLYKEDSVGNDISDVLEYVKNNIESGYDYYDQENEYVKRIGNMRKEALRNREHFADALLYHASSQIKHGLFTIGKQLDKKAKCWTLDCGWLVENERVLKRSGFMCDHCKFSERKSSTVAKMQSVKDKSLLKDGFWIRWC